MIFILAAVQALTEFLPVSSSGHLAALQALFPGVVDDEMALNVLLHAATLCSTILYFRKEVIDLVKQVFGGDLRFLILLIVGSIPAGILGLALKDNIESVFSSLAAVGLGLLLTSVLLEFARRKNAGDSELPTLPQALIIGTFQAMALVPGVSRSGSTICAALFVGMKAEAAFKFSFLLSLPAIFGATLLEASSIATLSEQNFAEVSLAFLLAFVLGYLSLVILNRFVKEKRFLPFSVYTACLGLYLLFG